MNKEKRKLEGNQSRFCTGDMKRGSTLSIKTQGGQNQQKQIMHGNSVMKHINSYANEK